MIFTSKETPEGKRWVKKTYNRETEKTETEELPVGEKLVFDPEEFFPGTEVLLAEEHPIEIATDDQGNPLSFEDFIQKIVDESPTPPKFKPSAFYSKAGDILQVHWKDEPYIGKWLGNGIDLYLKCKENEDEPDEIVGCMIWGIKTRLLKAYAKYEEE